MELADVSGEGGEPADLKKGGPYAGVKAFWRLLPIAPVVAKRTAKAGMLVCLPAARTPPYKPLHQSKWSKPGRPFLLILEDSEEFSI